MEDFFVNNEEHSICMDGQVWISSYYEKCQMQTIILQEENYWS